VKVVRFLSGILSLYVVLVWILSGLIHLWTIYIAYSIGGLFWGIVSFFFQVVSQLYWGFGAWQIDDFNSPYIQWLIVVGVMWIFQYVFATIVGAMEEKQNKNMNY
jgi:hypothetical protein